MSFANLGLCEPLVRAVNECGYTEPTPIQLQAIPVVLQGRDLLAAAQTGTGKTAGFTLPILQHLETKPVGKLPNGRYPIRVLVLTPTRELAAQVHESVRDYGKHLSHNAACVFGGVNINPQIAQLRGKVDVLVATPGRLLDHVGQRTVDLSHVEILVLDEADRMLDMGFLPDIKKVLKLLPKQRQNLLFSATFSDEIRALTQGLLDNPASVEVARRNAPAEAVEQMVIEVEKGAKRAVLSHLIRTEKWFQVLVFTRTKHGANRLAEQLGKDGIESLAIHGNKSQNARTRALAQFKDGSLQVLVATDIAARGLDIEELPQVVNYELPNVPEDYVHRIGRTGRAGASGKALSLVSADERGMLHDIERLLKRQLPRGTPADFDMNAANAAARAAGPERDERDERGPRGGGRGQSRGGRGGSGDSPPRRRRSGALRRGQHRRPRAGGTPGRLVRRTGSSVAGRTGRRAPCRRRPVDRRPRPWRWRWRGRPGSRRPGTRRSGSRWPRSGQPGARQPRTRWRQSGRLGIRRARRAEPSQRGTRRADRRSPRPANRRRQSERRTAPPEHRPGCRADVGDHAAVQPLTGLPAAVPRARLHLPLPAARDAPRQPLRHAAGLDSRPRSARRFTEMRTSSL
ncbi:MAG: DEAD/DEAH box helicase [Burkholderiaceae bacterium]|nr:DEAD/DEAH box helicase [Burkholderiaceae bacterium]